MEEFDIADSESLMQAKDNEDHGGHGPKITNSSVVGGAFNTANTILGASVITIPSVMKIYGIVLGTFFIVIVGMITVLTV